jgi:plastocyanin
MKKILLTTIFSLLCCVTAAKADDVNITQANQQFSDDAIKIKAGDTVIFKNADTVTHNIQVVNSDGDTEDKGLQKPGENIKETFAKAGDYKVRCGIHPSMKLKISVQ